VPQFRVSQAAELLGVSDDTVRRYVENGALQATKDPSNRMVIDGALLAEFAHAHSPVAPDATGVRRSARNQLVGLVTSVVAHTVMAQVEMQCGPYRVVSLMSTEAVRELALAPGSLAVALIKSTNVILEIPKAPPAVTDQGAGLNGGPESHR
jgi:molybdopterin-binding protein